MLFHYLRNSSYLCDAILAEGFIKQTEVVLAVLLTLHLELYLVHVNRTRNNHVHDLTVRYTCGITHTGD